jgi:hypothetical protein
MKTKNSIKSLGISLEDLYECKSQLIIKLSDKPYEFHVVLKDFADAIDCKISSWGANLWVRTNKGMKYEKYNSLATLQTSLVRLIKTKVNTEGDITFSLSNEICKI